jgi:hypothetical protein
LSPLEVRIPHNLGVDGAREKIDTAITRARAQYEPQVGPIHANWDQDNQLSVEFAAMGMPFKSQVEVLPEELVIQIELPAMASMFAERFLFCDDFSIRCTIVPETLKLILVFSGTIDGETSHGHNS